MNEQPRGVNELVIIDSSNQERGKMSSSSPPSEAVEGLVVPNKLDDNHVKDVDCSAATEDNSNGQSNGGGSWHDGDDESSPPQNLRRSGSTIIPSEAMPVDHNSGNEVAMEPSSPVMAAPRRTMVQGENNLHVSPSIVPSSHPSMKAVTTWSSGVTLNVDNSNGEVRDVQRSVSTVTTASTSTISTNGTRDTVDSTNFSSGSTISASATTPNPPLPPSTAGARRARRPGNNNLRRMNSLEKSRIAPATVPGAVPSSGTASSGEDEQQQEDGAARQEYPMPGAVQISDKRTNDTNNKSSATSDESYNEKIRREKEEVLLRGAGPTLNIQVSENYDETHDRQNTSSLSNSQRESHNATNQGTAKLSSGHASGNLGKSPKGGRSSKQELLRSSQAKTTSSSNSKFAAAAIRPSNSRSSSDIIDEDDGRYHEDGFSESFTRVEAFLVQDDENDQSRQGTNEDEATRRRLEEIARREEALAQRERYLQQSMIGGGIQPPSSPSTPVTATATVTGTASRPLPGMVIAHATPLVRTARGESSLERIAKAFRRDMVVSTHNYHMKKYKKTFTGREAVNYFVESGIATTRQGGTLLGRRLLEELRLFHHVCYEHTFKDANLFYRFYEDDGTNDDSTSNEDDLGSSIASSLEHEDDKKMPADNNRNKRAGLGKLFRGGRSTGRSKSPRERSKSDQQPSQLPMTRSYPRSSSVGNIWTSSGRVHSSIPRFSVNEIKFGKIFTPDDKRCPTALVDKVMLDPTFRFGSPEDDVRRVDLTCQLMEHNASSDNRDLSMRWKKKNKDNGLFIVKFVHHDLIRRNLSADQQKHRTRSIQKLKAEVSLLSQMQHEHIVAVVGASSIFSTDTHLGKDADDFDCSFGKHNNFPTPYFFLTENCTANGTLKQRLDSKWNQSGTFKKKSLESTLLDRLLAATDLASAISFLHSNNIMHADIQPLNIGFIENPQGSHSGLKLFNFHRARALKRSPEHKDFGKPQEPYDVSLVSHNKLAGALPYAAPEIAITDDFCCGLGVDTYAFGILLWEMLTLDKAVDDFHQFLMEDKKFEGSITPKLDGSIPFQFHDLLSQCWNDRHFRPRMNVIHKFMTNFENQMRGSY